MVVGKGDEEGSNDFQVSTKVPLFASGRRRKMLRADGKSGKSLWADFFFPSLADTDSSINAINTADTILYIIFTF